MGLIPNDRRHLLRIETSHKTLLKIFYYKIKVTTKAKDSLIKKFISVFNLIVINTTNFSNSFHTQKFLKDTIFSFLISWVKCLVRNVLMES